MLDKGLTDSRLRAFNPQLTLGINYTPNVQLAAQRTLNESKALHIEQRLTKSAWWSLKASPPRVGKTQLIFFYGHPLFWHLFSNVTSL